MQSIAAELFQMTAGSVSFKNGNTGKNSDKFASVFENTLQKASNASYKDTLRKKRQTLVNSENQQSVKTNSREIPETNNVSDKKCAEQSKSPARERENSNIQEYRKSDDVTENILNVMAQLRAGGLDELADLMSVLSKEFASESICEKFTEALEQLMPGKSEVSENKADKLLKLIEWLNEYTKKLEAVLPENAGKFEELTEKLSDIIKDIQNMNNETSVAFDKEITEILRELIRTDNKNSKAVSEQKGEPVGENATEAYLEKNGDKNASANGKTDMEAQKETDTFIVKNNGKEKIKTHAEYNFKTASEDGSIEINKTNNSAKYFNNETQFEGDTLSDVFTHDASPKNMETEITVSGFRPETSRQTGLNPARIINQVINKAKVIIDGEKSEMVVNLKPDNLGKLSLKVITENGLVTAEITAENHQVKQMLEANMQQMKQSFEERGMFVESFTVSVRQDGRNNEGKRFFKQGSFKAGSISIDTSGKTSAYGGSFSDVSLIDPYFLEDSTINLTA